MRTLLRAIAAGARSERDSNGVADAVVKKNAERCGGPDLALHAHARFGEAKMQRLLGFAGEVAIDGDEVARAGSFAGNDDLIVAQAGLEREFRGLKARRGPCIR